MGGQRNGQQRPAQPAVTQTQPAGSDTVVYKAEGTWKYTIDSPQGGDGTIVITNENGVYSGTIKNARMPQETKLNNVQVNRNDVSFSYRVNFGGNTNTVDVKYTVNNNSIQGTMNIGGFRSFNLTGTRSE
jgi:hypothetical protein